MNDLKKLLNDALAICDEIETEREKSDQLINDAKDMGCTHNDVSGIIESSADIAEMQWNRLCLILTRAEVVAMLELRNARIKVANRRIPKRPDEAPIQEYERSEMEAIRGKYFQSDDYTNHLEIPVLSSPVSDDKAA